MGGSSFVISRILRGPGGTRWRIAGYRHEKSARYRTQLLGLSGSVPVLDVAEGAEFPVRIDTILATGFCSHERIAGWTRLRLRSVISKRTRRLA